mgnify:CR=1 FL=1
MNTELIEENKDLAALIKRVENRVAENGYEPGVCLLTPQNRIVQIVKIDVRINVKYGMHEFIVFAYCRGWLKSNAWSGLSRILIQLTSIIHPVFQPIIVPNPEEQDG